MGVEFIPGHQSHIKITGMVSTPTSYRQKMQESSCPQMSTDPAEHPQLVCSAGEVPRSGSESSPRGPNHEQTSHSGLRPPTALTGTVGVLKQQLANFFFAKGQTLLHSAAEPKSRYCGDVNK